MDSPQPGPDLLSDGSDSDDDAYEREQLEIALYSQIHFEENDEALGIAGVNEDDHVVEAFRFDVTGDTREGFVAIDTSADYVLNHSIEEKYGHLPDKADLLYKVNKTPRTQTGDSSKMKKSAQMSANKTKLIKGSEKESGKSKVKKEKTGRKSADMLILGEESDSMEVITIPDSDTSAIDSDADSVYGVLGKEETHDDNLHINVTPGGNDSNDWTINKADRVTGGTDVNTMRGRYCKPVKCYNCNLTGHLSMNCPQPKKVQVCILCSEPGHTSYKCPMSFCFNCNEPGHAVKACTAPRRSQYKKCFRCNMYGHQKGDCPDIWRQYHLTITPGNLKEQKGKVKKRKHETCYNCGMKGHLGYECDEDRMTRFVQVHSPYVCQYLEPWEFRDMDTEGDDADDYDEDIGPPPHKKLKSKHTHFHDEPVHIEISINNEGRKFKPGIIRKSDYKSSDPSAWQSMGISGMSGEEPVSGDGDGRVGKSSKKDSKHSKTGKHNKSSKVSPKVDKEVLGRSNFDKLKSSDEYLKSSKTKSKKKKKAEREGYDVKTERRSKHKYGSEHDIQGSKNSTSTRSDRQGKQRSYERISPVADFPRGNNLYDMSVTCSRSDSRTVDVYNGTVVNEQLQDLFSLRKIQSVKAGFVEDIDPHQIQDDDENEFDHQAYNNEWWRKKNKKKKKHKKKSKDP